MKRKIIIFILLWTAYLLQTAVFPMINFLSTTPNFLMILTVAIGFMQGTKEGLLTGFAAGLLIDFTWGNVFGFRALIYMLSGYFSGTFAQIYFDEDVKLPLLLTAGCDLVLNAAVYAADFLLRGRTQLLGYLKSIIIPEVICTMLFTVLLYRLIYKINYALAEKEKKGRQSLWIRD